MQLPNRGGYGRLTNADITDTISSFLGPRDALRLVQASRQTYNDLSAHVRDQQSVTLLADSIERIHSFSGDIEYLLIQARNDPDDVAVALADAFTVTNSMQGSDGQCFIPTEPHQKTQSLAALCSTSRKQSEVDEIGRYIEADYTVKHHALELLCVYNALFEIHDAWDSLKDDFAHIVDRSTPIGVLLQAADIEFGWHRPFYISSNDPFSGGPWAGKLHPSIRSAITTTVFRGTPTLNNSPIGTPESWAFCDIPYVTDLVQPAGDRRVHLRLTPLSEQQIQHIQTYATECVFNAVKIEFLEQKVANAKADVAAAMDDLLML